MKKFIAGIICGALVTSATAVVAAGPEQIVAYLRSDFNVALNGKKAELANSPAIIDGSMYLPLKEVAGLVGVDVAWNEETQTAELRSGTVGEPSAKPTLKPAEKEVSIVILKDYLPSDSSAPAISINNTIFLPAREGAEKHGIQLNEIEYDHSSRSVGFTGSKTTVKIQDSYDSSADAFLLNGTAYIREDILLSIKN